MYMTRLRVNAKIFCPVFRHVLILFILLALLHYDTTCVASSRLGKKKQVNNIDKVNVFVSVNGPNIDGNVYPPCYRQPVLFTHKQTVFAFATGRNKTGTSASLCSDPGDGSPNYIVMKTSVDHGNSFSKLKILVAGEGNTQPDFYVVYYSSIDDAIHIVYETPSNVYDIRSEDLGLTWSKPKAMIIDFDKNTFARVSPSVGKGLNVMTNTRGHDLVVLPFICSTMKDKSDFLTGDKGVCPQCHSCLIFSKQNNHSSQFLSWTVGAVTKHHGRESQIEVR